jgi:hypothetical protein
MILEKNITKKENTKETGKKLWGKTVSIHSVFWGKTCIYL